MPKLIVDGIEVEVPPGATVLQACEAAGKEVPGQHAISRAHRDDRPERVARGLAAGQFYYQSVPGRFCLVRHECRRRMDVRNAEILSPVAVPVDLGQAPPECPLLEERPHACGGNLGERPARQVREQLRRHEIAPVVGLASKSINRSPSGW